jgi:hypothetical protein
MLSSLVLDNKCQITPHRNLPIFLPAEIFSTKLSLDVRKKSNPNKLGFSSLSRRLPPFYTFHQQCQVYYLKNREK